MKSFNLSRWAIEHAALTRYLMWVLMVLGVFAYFQLGQDEDPPFTFRIMVVRTFWPGATAHEMAEQVTDRVEKVLQETPYADKIQSYSKPGESLVLFQLKDSSNPKDVSQLWYTVRKKIGDARSNFPAGVIGPFFNDEFGDVYGVILALNGSGYTPAELKHQAEELRRALLKVPDVSKVELFGTQDEKIYIELSQQKVAQMGIDLQAVMQQLSQQNGLQSAGAALRVDGALDDLKPLRELPIQIPGKPQIRLSDIAQITRTYVDPSIVRVRHQGEPVIAMGISMSKGGDIIDLGNSLKALMPELQNQLPIGMSLSWIQDQPEAVSKSVNEFIKVLIEAVVIVLAVSFLSLGLHKRAGLHPVHRRWILDIRPGLVVGITIPLVLTMPSLL